MKAFFAITLILVAKLLAAEKTSYTGYKLYSVTIPDENALELIHSLEDTDPEFDIWNEAKLGGKMTAQIMLSPKAQTKYVNMFKAKKVELDIISPNVQDMIDFQEKTMSPREGRQARNIINRYARFSEIRNFLEETVENNKELTSIYKIGQGFESPADRPLNVILFKTPTARRSIWIDCGIHAREWVTPATCVYIIDRLATEYRAGDVDTVNLLDKYEIHILPVYNPDGYEFTHETTRLWRKNRNNQTGSCIGIDLNRNCDWRWMEIGASALPCSDTYAGPSRGSEVETKAVTQALKNKEGDWDAYFSIHSYGDWWLTPWGHSALDIPTNMPDLMEVGNAGADAIRNVNGEVFRVGSSSALLYPTSGSSADWAYGAINVPYSYTLELRPGAGTPDYAFGFTLPESRLPLVTSETWAGVKAAMLRISAKLP